MPERLGQGNPEVHGLGNPETALNQWRTRADRWIFQLPHPAAQRWAIIIIILGVNLFILFLSCIVLFVLRLISIEIHCLITNCGETYVT